MLCSYPNAISCTHIHSTFPNDYSNFLLLDRIGGIHSHTLRRQHNVQLQLLRRSAARTLVLAHARRDAVDGREVDDQVVLDGEDGVGLEPGVVFWVDLGDDWFVLVVCDLQNASQRLCELY